MMILYFGRVGEGGELSETWEVEEAVEYRGRESPKADSHSVVIVSEIDWRVVEEVGAVGHAQVALEEERLVP